jgi:hypothetical protein
MMEYEFEVKNYLKLTQQNVNRAYYQKKNVSTFTSFCSLDDQFYGDDIG